MNIISENNRPTFKGELELNVLKYDKPKRQNRGCMDTHCITLNISKEDVDDWFAYDVLDQVAEQLKLQFINECNNIKS